MAKIGSNSKRPLGCIAMRKKRSLSMAGLIALLHFSLPVFAGTEYTFKIDTGCASTSGGFTGQGIGDVTIFGTFKLYLDAAANSSRIDNIDMRHTDSHGNTRSFNSVDWASYRGTFDGAQFSMTSYIAGYATTRIITGTYSNTQLYMSGTVADSYNDGYTYDLEIHATAMLKPSDFNGDGVVEASDLALLLDNWGWKHQAA